MSKNRRHGVKINMIPKQSEVLYEGNVNDKNFTISYHKEYDAEYDEFNEDVNVLWEDKIEEQKIYTEAVKKIFKNKLNAERS